MHNENICLGEGDSSPNFPCVSVIIPTLNAEATIAEALDSVLSQDYAGPVEVIVVDGSDTPATSEVVRRHYPAVRLVSNPDQAIAPGVNAAMRMATGDIIVRCDAHTFFPPGYLQRAVETLERTGAANVGGRQQPVGRTLFQRSVAIAMTTLLGAGDSRYRLGGAEGAVDTVYLGVYRREALDAVGGYNTSLIRAEDYELNYRLRKQGKTVWFDPELVVRYWPRSTPWSLARQYFEYGRWKSVVFMTHPASARLHYFAAPVIVLALAAAAAAALAGFLWLAAATLFAYILVLVATSVVVGFRLRDAATVLLPLALTIMHLSWGIGFLLPARVRRSAATGTSRQGERGNRSEK